MSVWCSEKIYFLLTRRKILMAGLRNVLFATHQWSLSRYTRRIAIVRNSNWVRRKRFWLPTHLCYWRPRLLLWNSPLNRLKSGKKRFDLIKLLKQIVSTGCDSFKAQHYFFSKNVNFFQSFYFRNLFYIVDIFKCLLCLYFM